MRGGRKEGGFNKKHLYPPPSHERTLNPIKIINRLSVALRRKFTLSFPASSRLVWRVRLARPVFSSPEKNKNNNTDNDNDNPPELLLGLSHLLHM